METVGGSTATRASRGPGATEATREPAGAAAERREAIKQEVVVKMEPVELECLVCAARCGDAFDVHETRTAGAGTALAAFLARYAPPPAPRHVCRACRDLIDVLESAEREYLRLRAAFEALLSRNPLFPAPARPAPPAPPAHPAHPALALVKSDPAEDSEDEPLARARRKRAGKTVKKKKKTLSAGKKRKNSDCDKYNWECDECDAQGDTGGPFALAAHKITEHATNNAITETAIPVIKTEDTNDLDAERSQSPYNTELDNGSELDFGDFDDDDADSTFNPDEFLLEPKKKAKTKETTRTTFKRPKVWHPCDQCNARYSSLARLEQHKQKHDGSKPPYICEVCGAHYKHKRACDIHIALHKGISDWKCEECNKLFPSKNALQRHNNIHTGKLNYQCDLCGKSFIHTSSFKMHKLSHSGVKPHACDVCGLALMTRSHLKRHKRIHSGEKRHECHVCGKRFSERYNLAAHAKSHEAPALEAAPRRRLFRCHFCTERFERRYMLERHMSALHGRTLERVPPTPRNTMSKLLKAQAQARQHPPPEGESKDGATEARAQISAVAPSKLLAQLTSPSPSLIQGAWGAPYAELTYTQP